MRHKGCLYTYKGHHEAINAVQFSPDGKWVVSASSDKVVRVSVHPLLKYLSNEDMYMSISITCICPFYIHVSISYGISMPLNV